MRSSKKSKYRILAVYGALRQCSEVLQLQKYKFTSEFRLFKLFWQIKPWRQSYNMFSKKIQQSLAQSVLKRNQKNHGTKYHGCRDRGFFRKVFCRNHKSCGKKMKELSQKIIWAQPSKRTHVIETSVVRSERITRGSVVAKICYPKSNEHMAKSMSFWHLWQSFSRRRNAVFLFKNG